MTADQVLYTHSNRPDAGGWAWVCPTAPGFDRTGLDDLRGRAKYRKPRFERMADLPPGEEGERLLPPTYSYVPAGESVSLIRVIPTGRSLSGEGERLGNALAHVRYGEDVASLRAGVDPSVRPMDAWSSECWVEREPSGDHIGTPGPITAGPGCDRESAVDFIAGHPVGSALDALVAAVIDAYFDRAPSSQAPTVCIVEDRPADLVAWMNAISQVLPVELAWEIGFVTYTPDPIEDARADPRPVADGHEDDGWVVPLVGSVPAYLNQDSLDERVVVFDFSASDLPFVSVGPLAEALTDGWPHAGTALIDAVDVLVRASELPADEDRWMVVVTAARLQLGHPVDEDDLGEVTRWLEHHCTTLGADLVSGVGMVIDPAVLTAGELLSLVAAGRRAGAGDVVVAFEHEAMERAVDEASDPAAPPPVVPRIDWSEPTAAAAVALVERRLAKAPPGTVGRLLAVADAMALDLSAVALATAGPDLLAEWLEAGRSGAVHAPRRYGRSLGHGVDRWLVGHPPDASSLERIRWSVHASGLASFLSTDAPRFPISAALAILRPGHPEERVAAARVLLDTEGHTWDTIDICLETLWGIDRVGIDDLEGVVSLFDPPVRSAWVAMQLGKLASAATRTEGLQHLTRLAKRAQVMDLLAAEPHRRLKLFADANRLAADAERMALIPGGGKIDRRAVERVVSEAMTIPRPSPAFLRPIAPLLLDLGPWPFASTLQKAAAIDATAGNNHLYNTVLDGLKGRAGIGTTGRTAHRATIAVACWCSIERLGSAKQQDLVDIIAACGPWEPSLIDEVTKQLANGMQAGGLARGWESWANKNLLGGGGLGQVVRGILKKTT